MGLGGTLLGTETMYGLQTGLVLGGTIQEDPRNLGCGLKPVASMLGLSTPISLKKWLS